MSKSEELSRKTRRMIAKNLIVLAALAVVAFVGVVSWFTKNTTATADGLSIKTQVSDGLEYYIMPPSSTDQYDAINQRLADNASDNANNTDGVQKRTTWHTSSDTVTFDTSEQEFNFMEGLFLCDVTGDGSVFKVPKLMQYGNIAYVDSSLDFEDAVANDQYLSFDLYFRSESSEADTINLLASSTISPSVIYDTAIVTDASNSDSYKDAAIGAVRMSVLNMESSGAREALWIPGPYVYYNGLTDKLYTGLSDTQYAPTVDNPRGAVYYNGSSLALYGEGTNDHAYYDANKERQIVSHSASNVFVGRQLGTDQPVVELTKAKKENENTANEKTYHYGHVRVNLWIEGEDAEARLACVGGKFSLSLNFELR